MRVGRYSIASNHVWLVFVLLVAACLIIDAVSAVRFSNIALDGISYITFAEQYAAGRLDSAVNALRSPLISILSAPLISMGLSGVNALLTVNAIAAITTVLSVALVVWRQTRGNIVSVILSIATVTPVLAWLATTATPDMLLTMFAATLLLAMVIVDDWTIKEISTKKIIVSGLVVGCIGALGILSKLFFLPFFVVSVLAWSALRLFGRPGKRSLFGIKHLKLSLAVPIMSIVFAFIFMTPWVGAIYVKYEKISLGSSFEKHIASRIGNEAVHITTLGGGNILSPPLDEYHTRYVDGVSGYADEGYIVESEQSKGIIDRAKFFVKQRLEVIPRYTSAVSSLSPYIIITGIFLAAAVLYKRVSYARSRGVVLAGVLGLIYYLGYATITVSFSETDGGPIRYYVPLLIYAAIIIFISLPTLYKGLRGVDIYRKLIFITVILIIPVLAMDYMPKLGGIVEEPPKNLRIEVAESIMSTSNKRSDLKLAGNIRRSVDSIAFFAQGQSFGSIGEDRKITDREVISELKKYNIDYFIEFTPTEVEAPGKLPAGVTVHEVFESDSFPCRDVRYGGRGAGFENESCLIRVLDVRKLTQN